jgi:inorganic pyrophosphatase/exopolyphosphatase
MGYAWLLNSQNDDEVVAVRGVVSRKKQLLPMALALLEE